MLEEEVDKSLWSFKASPCDSLLALPPSSSLPAIIINRLYEYLNSLTLNPQTTTNNTHRALPTMSACTRSVTRLLQGCLVRRRSTGLVASNNLPTVWPCLTQPTLRTNHTPHKPHTHSASQPCPHRRAAVAEGYSKA